MSSYYRKYKNTIV